MQTTPETQALLGELYERSLIAEELDGPQLEAWVSGLFPMFDDEVSPAAFVAYCAQQNSVVGNLLCLGIAELLTGLDDASAALASDAVSTSPVGSPAMAQLGESFLTAAWMVEAPFGRSVVLGFDNRIVTLVVGDEGEERQDLRHSVLVEVGSDGELLDLQLTGPPASLLEEATAVDDRVSVTEVDPADALQLVIDAWPESGANQTALGPGVASNQQFVRRRVYQATGATLATLTVGTPSIDVRRGLDDREFAQANQAALSTLQAALGSRPTADSINADPQLVETWAGLIRGDGADLSPRERDGLLWLEWADWLGAGIGLARAGANAPATGETLVDYVNRCPEVSSTIDKQDREYAAWAFAIALDVLEDAGCVAEGQLTDAGLAAVGPGMRAAWTPERADG